MAKRKRRKKSPPTADQLVRMEKRKLSRAVENVFTRVGFLQVATVGTTISFGGGTTDIDQMFIGEGCVVLVEETVLSKTKEIRDHLNKKIIFYDKVWGKERAFLAYLQKTFPEIETEIKHFKLKFVYASRFPFEKEEKPEFKNVIFMRNEYLKHFLHLTKTIGSSARFEVYKFLALELSDVKPDNPNCEYTFDGFVLPDNKSDFGDDFKIVTFYMDPASLIELGYSLRRDSWMDIEGLYQRILSAPKIRKMRAFLKSEGHVYINNIIVGLPHDVQIKSTKGTAIAFESLTRVTVVKVTLPTRFNSIGLIDGQHRVFSYHEGKDAFEQWIKPKRIKQQLLVTGLVFPAALSDAERLKKEAKIFLEINAEQTSAKSELKQAIATIVSPYSAVAIAKSVISYLAKKGPLAGKLHDHFYDDGVIKTASIISYGLKYVVDVSSPVSKQSFFSKLTPTKAEQLNKGDAAAREEYVTFCGEHLNRILGGFFANVPKEFLDPANPEGRAYSVTMLNGLLYCTRRLLQEDRLAEETPTYIAAFAKHGLNFKRGSFKSKSSQWKSLGDDLAKKCFDLDPAVET